MPSNKSRVDALRQRAIDVLKRKNEEDLLMSTSQFFEEVQIYEAELEIQNDELKKSQQQLQEQLFHYRQLFHSLPGISLLIGKKGEVLDVNGQGMSALGFRAPEMMRSKSLLRFMDRDTGQWLIQLLRGDVSFSIDDIIYPVLRSRKGQTIPCRGNFVRLPEKNSLDASFIFSLMDIRSEVALENENDLFRLILDNSQNMIFVVNHDYEILLANKELARFTQMKGADPCGQNLQDCMPESYINKMTQFYDGLFLRGIPTSFIYESSVQTNKQTLSTTGFPLRDSEGKIFAAGFITSDITERTEIEEQLQTAMQIFGEGSEGILICNSDIEINSVNKAFITMTGCSESELIGSVPEFLREDFRNDGAREELLQILAETGHWEGQIANQRKTGDTFPAWISISRVPRFGKTRNYIVLCSDLTERINAQKDIEKLAFYDALTGMANRTLLKDRLEQLIRNYNRSNIGFSLIFVDLDQFKEINDVHGHDTGDKVLKEIALRAGKLFRDTDTLCRLGGDEFVFVLLDSDVGITQFKVQQLLLEIQRPINVDNLTLEVTASAGIVRFPEDGATYNSLMQYADFAMYHAKSAGKNQYSVFERELIEEMQNKVNLSSALKEALDKNEFSVNFQPIFNGGGAIVAVEALLRWNNPNFVGVGPENFVPVLEQNRYIVDVGEWVLRHSVAFMAKLNQDLDMRISCCVNISLIQFSQDNFPDVLQDILNSFEFPAELLELEITERIAMEEPYKAKQMIERIKQCGIRIAMDDFGTGYSSLAYLKQLPIDILKIDQSFVRDIGKDRDDEAICQAIVHLAETLNLKTIAEGVENEEQLSYLKSINCNYFQGYRLCHYLTEQEVYGFLSQYHH